MNTAAPYIGLALILLVIWHMFTNYGQPLPAPPPPVRVVPPEKRWLLEKYDDQMPPYPDSWYES